MKKNKLKHWELVKTETGPDLIISKVRFDWRKNPRNNTQLKCVILESGDWVNVVALTPENELVIVQQYRFGVGEIASEIPGGMMEAGESPQNAAMRELKEETGYTSDEWVSLGVVSPNPAIRNNRCHHWLAKNAKKTDATNLDEGEDLAVFTMPLPKVKQAIFDGEMYNALDISALSRVIDLRRV